MDMSERFDGRTLAAIMVALLTWSSAYAAIAYTLPYFSPGEVALARLGFGAVCFVVLAKVTHVALPARRDWPQVALLGVTGLTVYHLCLNYAETRIASGTAAILIALVPAATAAISALWVRERLPLRTWVGFGIALVGTVLVVLASGQRVQMDPMALLVLVCVVVTAFYFVGLKPLFARSSTLGVTAATFCAGAVAAVPFGWRLPHAVAMAPWPPLLALVWLGIAPTVVGYLAWNFAVQRTSASRVSSFLYLSPPIALLIGWMWLHEVPHALILVGGAITVGGVILANWRRTPMRVTPIATVATGG